MNHHFSVHSLRRSIGLVIDDREVALSVVATTPLGRREIEHKIQPCDGQPHETVLQQLLQPWIGDGSPKRPRARPRVKVGLGEGRVFQAVVPLTSANRSASPQSLFLEAVQATNLRAEERVIDVVKLELNKQPLACLAACPRAMVTELIETLDNLGTKVSVVEPAPDALFRAGEFHKKVPRGSKVSLRFFLGREQAVGILAAGSLPLCWHCFLLPPGEETAAILAGYSTLWMLGRHSRITKAIDTVVIHGRPELALDFDSDSFLQRTGARLIRHPTPEHDPASAALGVALSNPAADEPGFDLARTLKRPNTIREVFPWGELILQGTLIAGVSLFLDGVATEYTTQLKAAHAESSTFSWLKDQDQAKLDAEKKDLAERTKAVAAFTSTRVDWSAQLRTIAADTPETTVITSLQGEGEVSATGKGSLNKPKKQLIVNFATPMTADGAIPAQINSFVAALRAEAVISQQFPIVEVSGLRAEPAKKNSDPFAAFSVVCLPKVEAAKGAAPKGTANPR